MEWESVRDPVHYAYEVRLRGATSESTFEVGFVASIRIVDSSLFNDTQLVPKSLY